MPVIGSEYKKDSGGIYTGEKLGKPCFGINKTVAVDSWLRARFSEFHISESWSDSISDKPMMMLASKRVWVGSAKKFLKVLEVDHQSTLFSE